MSKRKRKPVEVKLAFGRRLEQSDNAAKSLVASASTLTHREPRSTPAPERRPSSSPPGAGHPRSRASDPQHSSRDQDGVAAARPLRERSSSSTSSATPDERAPPNSRGKRRVRSHRSASAHTKKAPSARPGSRGGQKKINPKAAATSLTPARSVGSPQSRSSSRSGGGYSPARSQPVGAETTNELDASRPPHLQAALGETVTHRKRSSTSIASERTAEDVENVDPNGCSSRRALTTDGASVASVRSPRSPSHVAADDESLSSGCSNFVTSMPAAKNSETQSRRPSEGTSLALLTPKPRNPHFARMHVPNHGLPPDVDVHAAGASSLDFEFDCRGRGPAPDVSSGRGRVDREQRQRGAPRHRVDHAFAEAEAASVWGESASASHEMPVRSSPRTARDADCNELQWRSMASGQRATSGGQCDYTCDARRSGRSYRSTHVESAQMHGDPDGTAACHVTESPVEMRTYTMHHRAEACVGRDMPHSRDGGTSFHLATGEEIHAASDCDNGGDDSDHDLLHDALEVYDTGRAGSACESTVHACDVQVSPDRHSRSPQLYNRGAKHAHNDGAESRASTSPRRGLRAWESAARVRERIRPQSRASRVAHPEQHRPQETSATGAEHAKEPYFSERSRKQQRSEPPRPSFSSPISSNSSPPKAEDFDAARHQTEGAAASGKLPSSAATGAVAAGEKDGVELLYDPILQCYLDPRTNAYISIS